ncbi:aminoacylase 1-like protein 2 [Panus rudis PR-1116 ss-1]|nr:aminoacylase 1-like protein 2 [Panus rudis PR-1116 ss-1]
MCGDSRTAAAASGVFWRPNDNVSRTQGNGQDIYRPELFDTIAASIDALSNDFRALSLDLHEHPEIKFEEHYAHDVLSDFMIKQGFEVKKHHILPTAWEATFTHGSGGRTIGINSEMDALPGIGHACGHNLIAIAGVAVACAIRDALKKWDISGKVVLLGTPAEEGGHGKVYLLEGDAYKGMDVCLMCHPAPGPSHSASLSSSLALQRLEVEFTGHTAHAALAPWEGRNALDAAVSSYVNISMLRQQLEPDHRVHGIVQGRDWAPNIIPDYAKLLYWIRAKTWADVSSTIPRVINCIEAGGLAAACEISIQRTGADLDLRQNKALGAEFARVFESKFGPIDYEYGIANASTDFGNVTYEVPAIHPGYGIPTVVDGGNHTRAFTDSAQTIEAHEATLDVSKALAAVGMRVLTDDSYFKEVKDTFEELIRLRGGPPTKAETTST